MDEHETSEEAAQREVSEEAGIKPNCSRQSTRSITGFMSRSAVGGSACINSSSFTLMRYVSGDPDEHDQEVKEARWVEIDQAHAMLAFENEKNVILKAKDLIDRI